MPNDLPLEGETSPAELTTWISQHLGRGAAPDQITTELVSFGWTRESASSIVNATRDTISVIVIKSWLKIVAGWVILLGGIILLVLTWSLIAEGLRNPGGIAFMGGFTVIMFLFAAWLLGSTTKIRFSPGYMVVSRGHILLFLWFLRTKHISKDEAKSAFVASPWYLSDWGGGRQAYQVRVVRESGKAVILYWDFHEDVTDHLAQRIREFGLKS